MEQQLTITVSGTALYHDSSSKHICFVFGTRGILCFVHRKQSSVWSCQHGHDSVGFHISNSGHLLTHHTWEKKTALSDQPTDQQSNQLTYQPTTQPVEPAAQSINQAKKQKNKELINQPHCHV